MKAKSFFNNFYKRQGLYILGAFIFEKLVGLITILIASNLLMKDVFGNITYANSLLTFVIPFVGVGLHHGFLRYGSLSKSQQEKKYLFNIVLKRGLLASFFMLFILLILAPYLTYNLKSAFVYLVIFSFQLIGLFLIELLKIYSQVINRNKLYFKIVLFHSVVLMILIPIGTFYFKGIGFVVSIVLIPFLIAGWFIFALKLTNYNTLLKPKFNFKKFLSYGVFTSFSGVLAQFLYVIDVMLIGNLLQNTNSIAQYKISSVLPFSFLFIPLVFMKTDFVVLARKTNIDNHYHKMYYLNYLKLMIPISVVLLLLFYIFSNKLFGLFGSQYNNNEGLMFIFSIGVVGALLFRIPLGNILSAIGKVRSNMIVSSISVVLNLILSYFLILSYGIFGAAISTAIIMWLSGLLSLIIFISTIKANK